MGFFDRFRRQPDRSTPSAQAPGAPPAASPAPSPMWQPTPATVAAMQVSSILTGVADDPAVMAVHASIERALAAAFGEQAALGWSRIPPGPLAHVRVYHVDDPAGAYFHYLGWGLTEMGPKASDDPSTSGFGIELSLKLRARPDERVDTPPLALRAPEWPLDLLSRLAAAIQRSRRPFGHDHWIEASGAFGPEQVRHLACAHDALPAIDTPNGRFRYLQLYTISDAELEAFKTAARAERDAPVLAARQAADPNLVIERAT